MAFFELLEELYSAAGSLVKQIGGRGIGGFSGDPQAFTVAIGNGEVGVAQFDGDGNLCVRSPVLTDEGSFRCDFYHGEEELTGTVTFTEGSSTVTGSGTAFLTEVDRDCFVKLGSHAATCYALVARVLSDEELELDEPYTGATGSGTGNNRDVPVVLGSGATEGTASSLLNLGLGTTNGAHSYAFRWADYSPLQAEAMISISQRIANQILYWGFQEEPGYEPVECARFEFDGTDATVIRCLTSCSAAAADRETTTAAVPFGGNTAAMHRYRIEYDRQAVTFLVDDTVVATHRIHIPEIYAEMGVFWGGKNTGTPASSTTLAMDSLFISNGNVLDVRSGWKGAPLPVRSGDDVHTITGSLTTTATSEATIVSYTVPAGKTLYLAGFSVSAGTTTVNAAVRIGKGAAPIVAPAAPGTVDSSCIRALFLMAKTNIGEDFSACPRYLSGPGETIRATVKPDGVTSTTWVMSLDFVLR